MSSTRLTPTKIICFARTFAKHAKELGNPVPTEPIFFLKPPSSLIGTGQAIVLPEQSDEVHHEGEIAIILSKSISHATSSEAAKAIGAWLALNDVTARDLQRQDGGRFTRAKGFDTFCPVGQSVKALQDWRATRILTRVNGSRRQDASLAEMLFTPVDLLMYASRFMRLEPGDIVSLGTPAGVDELRGGDQVSVQIIGPDGRVLSEASNPVIGHQFK